MIQGKQKTALPVGAGKAAVETGWPGCAPYIMEQYIA